MTHISFVCRIKAVLLLSAIIIIIIIITDTYAHTHARAHIQRRYMSTSAVGGNKGMWAAAAAATTGAASLLLLMRRQRSTTPTRPSGYEHYIRANQYMVTDLHVLRAKCSQLEHDLAVAETNALHLKHANTTLSNEADVLKLRITELERALGDAHESSQVVDSSSSSDAFVRLQPSSSDRRGSRIHHHHHGVDKATQSDDDDKAKLKQLRASATQAEQKLKQLHDNDNALRVRIAALDRKHKWLVEHTHSARQAYIDACDYANRTTMGADVCMQHMDDVVNALVHTKRILDVRLNAVRGMEIYAHVHAKRMREYQQRMEDELRAREARISRGQGMAAAELSHQQHTEAEEARLAAGWTALQEARQRSEAEIRQYAAQQYESLQQQMQQHESNLTLRSQALESEYTRKLEALQQDADTTQTRQRQALELERQHTLNALEQRRLDLEHAFQSRTEQLQSSAQAVLDQQRQAFEASAAHQVQQAQAQLQHERTQWEQQRHAAEADFNQKTQQLAYEWAQLRQQQHALHAMHIDDS